MLTSWVDCFGLFLVLGQRFLVLGKRLAEGETRTLVYDVAVVERKVLV